jgi:hypothetical protein
MHLWTMVLFVVGFVPAVAVMPAEAGCAGLKGAALERCLKGEVSDPGPKRIVFHGTDGTSHAIDSAAVSTSIESVCRAVKQDGLFTAYRSDADRARSRPWKEVECKARQVSGLWKEHFIDNDMTTVLSYDATGKAVKQAVFLNGRLVREHTYSTPSR